jgi:hypothetical protein
MSKQDAEGGGHQGYNDAVDDAVQVTWKKSNSIVVKVTDYK